MHFQAFWMDVYEDVQPQQGHFFPRSAGPESHGNLWSQENYFEDERNENQSGNSQYKQESYEFQHQQTQTFSSGYTFPNLQQTEDDNDPGTRQTSTTKKPHFSTATACTSNVATISCC